MSRRIKLNPRLGALVAKHRPPGPMTDAKADAATFAIMREMGVPEDILQGIKERNDARALRK